MSHILKVPMLWRTGAALALLPLLSSCGSDYSCNNCYTYTPVEFSAGVVAADFNNDTFPDILQQSTVPAGWGADPATIKSYLTTASGVFGAPTQTNDGDNPLYLASADLNGDGLPDVVSASVHNGALAVFFNNSLTPGTLNTPLVLDSPGASQLAIADVNGDGLADIVSADYKVSLFLQSSAGTFADPIPLYSGGANWVAVGDLDGDGMPDIVVTDDTGVHVLMHTGAASATTYATPVTVFTQTLNAHVSGWNLVAIADVDGDGLNDLVITDPGPTGGSAPTVNVLLQDPARHGMFLDAVSYAVAQASLAQSVIVQDLDGDGRPDIVIGGSDAVSVLLQDPANAGAFLAATNFAAPCANEVAVADVNGDGRPDIVTASGPSHPVDSGLVTTHPGVLLQSLGQAGTFAPLADLP